MLINKETGAVIATKVHIAERFWPKFWGLQFKKSIPEDYALIILNCNSIHTCFMRFDLDVVFVDRSFRVLKVYRGLKPFRMTPPVKDAYAVIELKAKKQPMETGQIFELA
ncbi:MAG: DUF192 domain-containing protein [Clostridia bacterium]